MSRHIFIHGFQSSFLIFYLSKSLISTMRHEIKYVVARNSKPFKYQHPKYKITLGDVMKIERDERRLDFHDIGREIKQKRERKGMTQEQLAYIIDRDPRTVMYHENDGQHPSLNVFYQLVTMFDISVDQFFYPDMGANDACKKRINIMLSSMNKKELELVEKLIRAVKDSQETEGA